MVACFTSRAMGQYASLASLRRDVTTSSQKIDQHRGAWQAGGAVALKAQSHQSTYTSLPLSINPTKRLISKRRTERGLEPNRYSRSAATKQSKQAEKVGGSLATSRKELICERLQTQETCSKRKLIYFQADICSSQAKFEDLKAPLVLDSVGVQD